MRAGKLENSPRLQRALKVLASAGGWVSTLTLQRRANLCAPGTVVSELRANGAKIECELRTVKYAGLNCRRWYYRLAEAPEGWS